MRRAGKRYIYLFIALLGLVSGCLAGLYTAQLPAADNTQPPAELPAKALPKPTIEEQAAAIVAAMTDEQKLGQLIMIGLPSTEYDAAAAELLSELRPGGIILFDRNLASPEQAKSFITELQAANKRRQPVGLFVAIDEEGGQVARMTDYLTVMPSAAEIGRSNNQRLAAEYAAQTAVELRVLGINVNFAPVADLGLAGERSYSTEPEAAANFVQSAVRAYEREGIIAAVKHFPGIGKAEVDPHLDSSQIVAPRTVLEREDLLPFKAAVTNLNNDAFMVMVAHLKYPALDKIYPASLSANIMTELLRGKMGYKGIIITDDLEMGGVANLFEFREMGVRAIKAGADIVLVCHEPEHQREVYDGMAAALFDGRLDRAAVEEKVRRIVRIKLKVMEKQNEAG